MVGLLRACIRCGNGLFRHAHVLSVRQLAEVLYEKMRERCGRPPAWFAGALSKFALGRQVQMV